jgi:methyl-accepting chemotaxis protein/methyl-accepting chemotaxis protein-1 (serine sensor receptor)
MKIQLTISRKIGIACGVSLGALMAETVFGVSELSRVGVDAGSMIALCVGCVLAGGCACWLTIRGIRRDLREMTTEMERAVRMIGVSAMRVAASSESLAEGSSQQAATIEETSSASFEVNSMAQRSTENSRRATEMVERSQERFRETNESLAQMLEAMAGIADSSRKISKIIKVIDEIAFQTNILALNAAVEAARAGDAGMGFAVVADEVRGLAQRCTQAARDTSSLIEDSIHRSGVGKSKVDQMAEDIRSITEESETMKALVDEINVGSVEQARGMKQIAEAMSQIERVTQHSAAGAVEGATAAQQLSEQAEMMQRVVEGLTKMLDGDPAERPRGGDERRWEPRATRFVATVPERSSALARTSASDVSVRRKEQPRAQARVQPVAVAIPMDDDFREF